jgi:hypothetical protein
MRCLNAGAVILASLAASAIFLKHVFNRFKFSKTKANANET